VHDLAVREQVNAALSEALGSRLSQLVSRDHRIALAIQHEANRKRNAAIAAAVHEIGEGFAAAGMRGAVLKGAAWVIEDRAGCAPWRGMVDIDIATEQSGFAEVEQVMAGLGFQPYLGPRETLAGARRSFQFPFQRSDLAVLVEIHRDLGWRRELLPIAIVFASAQPIDRGLVLPSPWCRAFHSIVHWMVQDQGWSRHMLGLKDMLEVARFLNRPDVDWKVLLGHARAVGVAKFCEAAVASSVLLLKARSPEEIAITPEATAWVRRALAVRESPERTWRATQIWRMSTLWNCDKISYRAARNGKGPLQIKTTLWLARIVRLPILGIRAMILATRCLLRAARGGAGATTR
jgi:hypothetical protein